MTKERKKQEGVGCIGDVLIPTTAAWGTGHCKLESSKKRAKGTAGDRITSLHRKRREGEAGHQRNKIATFALAGLI